MTEEDKIHIRAHDRRRTPKKKAEEAFIHEFPSIAPEHGVKIVDAKNKPTNAQGIERGVKRVGGADHGKIDKGVKRLGY